MISLPNCPITRQETDNQSHLRKLQYLRFKIYVTLYSNHTKTIIKNFASNLHNHKTQQQERAFRLLMLDTGIVYKHKGNINKNTQFHNAAKEIMILNNTKPPPPTPPTLFKKKTKKKNTQWTLPIHFVYQGLVNIAISLRLHCIDRRLFQQEKTFSCLHSLI